MATFGWKCVDTHAHILAWTFLRSLKLPVSVQAEQALCGVLARPRGCATCLADMRSLAPCAELSHGLTFISQRSKLQAERKWLLQLRQGAGAQAQAASDFPSGFLTWCLRPPGRSRQNPACPSVSFPFLPMGRVTPAPL